MACAAAVVLFAPRVTVSLVPVESTPVTATTSWSICAKDGVTPAGVIPDRGAFSVMVRSAATTATPSAPLGVYTGIPNACAAAVEPCAARVTVSLVLVASTAVTAMISDSAAMNAGAGAVRAGATVICVSAAAAATANVATEGAPVGTAANKEPTGSAPTVCVFVALSATVTVWFPAAPGNLEDRATVVAPAFPETATPVSVPPLATKTRETYSSDPPLSKNALTLRAR